MFHEGLPVIVRTHARWGVCLSLARSLETEGKARRRLCLPHKKEEKRSTPMEMMKDPIVLSGQQMPTAHLDEAHVGDIEGAWGTIRRHDTARRTTWWGRLLTLLIIMGPGLITMVGDN